MKLRFSTTIFGLYDQQNRAVANDREHDEYPVLN